MNATDYEAWKAQADTAPWNRERSGPHGQHGPSAAFAGIAKEESKKGISSAERSAAQTIENEIGSISDALGRLTTPDLWDQRQERIRLERDVEKRMELNTIFERDRANIPKVKADLEADMTALIKKLVPFAIKVVKLVVARLPAEIENADVSTQKNCQFFGISEAGSSDWITFPLQRLLQGLQSQLYFLERGDLTELQNVRQVLADSGVISPKCRV
jgi:hypothetical protein